MISSRVTRFGLLGLAIAVLLGMFGGKPADAQTTDGGVRGKLQYTADDPEQPGKVPIEGGVVIVYQAVLAADGTLQTLGDEVARGESDAEGNFQIALATPGDYAVEVDLASLPEGVELVNPDRAQLPIHLNRGDIKGVLFALAEGGSAETARTRVSDSVWDSAARLSVSGLQFGLIIGMCAIGLSLIFATTGLVNFAHSEMITIGAVITWWLNATVGLHLLVAAPIAMLIGGLLGAAMDAGLWRPLRRRGTGLVAMMIVSIGLAIALRYVVLYQFGDRRQPFEDYAVQTDALVTFGPVSLNPKDVFIIVTSAAMLVGVGLLLRFTKLGKAMRAIADNPDLAASTGIDVDRTVTVVWFMAGALVTIGAVYQGLTEQIQWQMGSQILLMVFAAVTLGGLGTAYGAMVGSIIVGVLINVAPVWTPPGLDEAVIPAEMKNAGALIVMIIVLMIRPQGIFGRRERVG